MGQNGPCNITSIGFCCTLCINKQQMRYLRTTYDAHIFMMTTVMDSPAAMATVSDGVLCTTAVHVIQQYGTGTCSKRNITAYCSSSTEDMFISSLISLIKSDLKWCIHLSKSLFFNLSHFILYVCIIWQLYRSFTTIYNTSLLTSIFIYIKQRIAINIKSLS